MDILLRGNTFVTGAVRNDEIGYIIATPTSIVSSEKQISKVFEYEEGHWYEDAAISFPTVGASICSLPKEQLIVLGPKGEAVFVGSGDVHAEQIPLTRQEGKDRGPLRSVSSIDGHAFAVGMQRQVYQRIDKDKWLSMDEDILPTGSAIVGFEAIDGFSRDNLYAVGWNGEIFHFEGNVWNNCTSPSNLVLTSVCCSPNGNVYIGGQAGLLVIGECDRWQILDHEVLTEDIWSLAWFKGVLYISTTQGVYRLEDGNVKEVKMGTIKPSSYHLSRCNDCLWSIGRRDVVRFDGNDWLKIA